MKTVDCRKYQIEGMEAYKVAADAALKNLATQRHVGVLLIVPDTNLLYVQYNFRYEAKDQYDLKMLQTVGYLKHAWKVFRESHKLEVIFYAEDLALQRVGSVTGPDGREVVALRKLTTGTVILPMAVTAPAAAKPLGKLFGWLQPTDWLKKLETRLALHAGDDFVDDDVLHEPLIDLKLRLVTRILESNNSESPTAKIELKRATDAYQKLARYSHVSSKTAWFQARALVAKDDPSTLALMGCFLAQSEALAKVGSWSYVELMFMDQLNKRAGEKGLRTYLEIAKESLPWRVLLDDPNAFLRQFVGKMEVWEILRTAGKNIRSADFAHIWYQIGLYCDSLGKVEEAKTAFEKATSWPVDDSREGCVRSVIVELRLAEIAYQTGDSGRALKKLVDIEKRLSAWEQKIGLSGTLRFRLRLHRIRTQARLYADEDNALAEAEIAFGIFSKSRLAYAHPAIPSEIALLHSEVAYAHRVFERETESERHLRKALDVLKPITSFRYQQEGDGPTPVLAYFPPFVTALKACKSLANLIISRGNAEEAVDILAKGVPVLAFAHANEYFKMAEFVPAFKDKLPGIENLPEFEAVSVVQEWADLAKGAMKQRS